MFWGGRGEGEVGVFFGTGIRSQSANSWNNPRKINIKFGEARRGGFKINCTLLCLPWERVFFGRRLEGGGISSSYINCEISKGTSGGGGEKKVE